MQSRPETPAPMGGPGGTRWPSYLPSPLYDELVGPDGAPRPAARALWDHLAELGPEVLVERQEAADREWDEDIQGAIQEGVAAGRAAAAPSEPATSPGA